MQIKQSRIFFTAAAVALMAIVFQMAQAHPPTDQDQAPDFLSSPKVLQETYNLSDFPKEVLVLMDTTHVGDITSGHVVATLPNEDGECNAGDTPFPDLLVLAGVAPEVEVVALQNTTISTGRTVTLAEQEVTTCVFHLDIEPGMEVITDDTIITLDRITDIAFINGSDDSMPSGTSIGVAVNLGEAGGHDHSH